jgi:NAD(P)-dependent dehydrogenase (short-subunit alcohol dehydrogenase family)
MRLDGRIGMVTAAGSGMGRAGALRFAREGASVGVVDVNAEAVERVVTEIVEAGGRATGIVADLRQDDDARRIIDETADVFGGLDFVWNHVGHPGPAAVEGVDWAAYELAMDLNVRSVIVTTEAAIPQLRARGGGALLFTASVSGLVGSRMSPIYSAAKFGVNGFMKALALRLAPDNIRVNSICPGPIDTPMLRVFVKRPDQKGTEDVDVEDLIYQRQSRVPMGRPGKPEEIANAALFLLSDEASFVTGVALPVDGGATAG